MIRMLSGIGALVQVVPSTRREGVCDWQQDDAFWQGKMLRWAGIGLAAQQIFGGAFYSTGEVHCRHGCLVKL
jgi:hypothetical protein